MVGKNNHEVKRQKNGNRIQRYAIKRLTIGVVSATVMTGFFLGNSEVALAAETVNSETVSEVASVDETELKDNDSEVTTASEEALSEESSVESPVTAEVAEESNSEVA